MLPSSKQSFLKWRKDGNLKSFHSNHSNKSSFLPESGKDSRLKMQSKASDYKQNKPVASTYVPVIKQEVTESGIQDDSASYFKEATRILAKKFSEKDLAAPNPERESIDV